jgi:hypothetical protein
MAIPSVCHACPAQLICDYGCHAFNIAKGNFFEVNCDASKDYFRWVTTHLEDAARIYFYIIWRERLKRGSNYEAVRGGTAVPLNLVTTLAEQLRRRLEDRLAQRDLERELLDQRYGWRDDLILANGGRLPRAVNTELTERG